MVLGLATTAFGALASIQYYGLDSDGAWDEDTGMSDYINTTLMAEDFEDLEADDDNYLPSYQIGSYFYVEVPEAAATVKLTYGAQKLFLTMVPESVVYFDVKADVYTNVTDEDDVCGTLYYATLSDEDVFYASYDKASKTYTYYVADENGTEALLVNGKIVEADEVGYGLTGHSYVGNTVVNKAYVDVKCQNCGKVAALYANATAAGKLAQPVGTLGWITFADMFTYGVTAAPEATDKVESAETFDAGIAMYVGMSVMAAAGSAVVLKKKD